MVGGVGGEEAVRTFTKDVRRLLRIPATGPGLEDAEFTVTVGPRGVSVRRKGYAKESERGVSWRNLVGFIQMHAPRGSGCSGSRR